jgi:Ni,Fe-hydrogenase I large subunit
MKKSVSINPVTRIEGHLAVKTEIESNVVTKAYCSGEMFRGFEVILRGRDPLDAQQIVQRICGVCPIAHGTASILAQDDAYEITTPENGLLMRNLILGANYIQSHILHFYHLSALDFVDITAVLKYKGNDPMLSTVKSWVSSQMANNVLYPAAPFLPRYEGKYIESTELNLIAIKHYLEGLEMRSLAHQMATLFAGKMPIASTLIPGGVTEKVTALKIASYGAMLDKLLGFIDNAYVPDVLEVAGAFPEYFKVGQSYGDFLSYGGFEESSRAGDKFLPAGTVIDGKLSSVDVRGISEDVGYSWFSSTSGLSPDSGETVPAPNKSKAYSWLKAPRYKGKPLEVGPLARMVVAYMEGSNSDITTLVNAVLGKVGGTPADLNSVLGRHAARAIECKVVAEKCREWLNALRPGGESCKPFKVPNRAQGVGLTEAPRGALGHWIDIDGHKIKNYQCVVPTTWNCSPRDDSGVAGPVEKAIEGTHVADSDNPIEAARIVRSYDPCMACAVH